MASPRLLFILCSIAIYLVALTVAQDQPLSFCLNKGNFTANSSYQANLNHLLSSLASNTEIDYGFYNASYGKNPDTVNAMALCRGDVKPDSCRSCISNLSIELTTKCPNQKEAIVWYDDCMLRYSNRSFFGKMEFGPYFWMYNLNNVTEVNQFNQVLGNLSDNLKKQAASGGSLRKFATGNATAPRSQTIYALMQCTPDLSAQECNDCLNNATKLIPTCCEGRQGGRVVAPSCSFRYEKEIFYGPKVHAATPTPSPSLSPSIPSPSSESPLAPPTPSPSLSPSTPSPSSESPSAPATPPPQSPSPSSGSPPTPQSPPTNEEVQSPSPPNSATQKGKESSLYRSVVLIAVPLLLLQHWSSMSALF